MKPHEYRVTEEELNAVRREAMEFSGVGIYRYLFDGTILFIDRMALRILDLEDAYPDPTMLAGRNIETLIIYTGPRGRLRQHIREHGHATGWEYSFRTLKGEERWAIHDSYLVQDTASGQEAIQVKIRNITGRKRSQDERAKLEARLQQAQKLEAIGTLAGGIAHDFNNLLMGILGNTSLMVSSMSPAHPDYDKLKHIEAYVKTGTELTRQLLGFARGGKYEVKVIQPNELMRKTAEMFGRTRKEIVIHMKLQEDGWPVEADQAQLEQVLLNLYINAWQAMPAGGDLYLETNNVALDEKYVAPHEVPAGRYVRISVTDTGVGMDQATLARVFEPFFTTKSRSAGTGLGLASAYGIIKNHGGIISAYSEKGHGATFNVYLPASSKTIAAQPHRADVLFKGAGTVLLVDDEQVILDTAGKMLQALGYTVLPAASGKEAADAYAAHRATIILVILDMIMPGIGGAETFDLIRKINPAAKVLLSSGYSLNGQAAKIIEHGCDGFIQKPFGLPELSRKMHDILMPKA